MECNREPLRRAEQPLYTVSLPNSRSTIAPIFPVRITLSRSRSQHRSSRVEHHYPLPFPQSIHLINTVHLQGRSGPTLLRLPSSLQKSLRRMLQSQKGCVETPNIVPTTQPRHMACGAILLSVGLLSLLFQDFLPQTVPTSQVSSKMKSYQRESTTRKSSRLYVGPLTSSLSHTDPLISIPPLDLVYLPMFNCPIACS